MMKHGCGEFKGEMAIDRGCVRWGIVVIMVAFHLTVRPIVANSVEVMRSSRCVPQTGTNGIGTDSSNKPVLLVFVSLSNFKVI